ncbi:hypothetical protein GCM10020331_040960 [Ectobacillus funiculus]
MTGMITKAYWKIFITRKKQKGRFLFMLSRKKGKGYKPAESDIVGTWHGTGPYKIESGDFVKPAGDPLPPAWSKIVSDTVLRMARDDDRIVAVTPAMPVGSKLEKNLRRNSQIVCLM